MHNPGKGRPVRGKGWNGLPLMLLRLRLHLPAWVQAKPPSAIQAAPRLVPKGTTGKRRSGGNPRHPG